jgi:hypothetical protein
MTRWSAWWVSGGIVETDSEGSPTCLMGTNVDNTLAMDGVTSQVRNQVHYLRLQTV